MPSRLRVGVQRETVKGEAPCSVVTVNRAPSTLRLLFDYAERCGCQISNPVKYVEFFREQGRERIISLEEEHE